MRKEPPKAMRNNLLQTLELLGITGEDRELFMEYVDRYAHAWADEVISDDEVAYYVDDAPAEYKDEIIDIENTLKAEQRKRNEELLK